MSSDAKAVPTVDTDILANFVCLRETGQFCQVPKLALTPFVQALPLPPDAADVQGSMERLASRTMADLRGAGFVVDAHGISAAQPLLDRSFDSWRDGLANGNRGRSE